MSLSAYDKPPAGGERLNTDYKYPGTIALVKVIKTRYPHLRFNGLYAPRKVAGTNTPSAHQVARGIDFSVDDAVGKSEAEALFWWLISVAEKVGIQGDIFDHKIWGFGDRNVRRTHRDGNPHTDHIHFEQNIAGAKLSEAEIVHRLGGGFLMALSDTQQTEVHQGIDTANKKLDKLTLELTDDDPANRLVARIDQKLDQINQRLAAIESKVK